MPLDEAVLGISKQHFEAVGAFTGFRQFAADYCKALLDATVFAFRPRAEIESDPDFKQLIPYVILRYQNQLFHYRRGGAGTETRLQSLRSLGIGGHISEADAAGGADPYRTGLQRELAEEVSLHSGYTERTLGFIYDPATLVGSVHIGVVHLFELEFPNVTVREEGLMESGFSTLDRLQHQATEFESWSQLVLAELTARA